MLVKKAMMAVVGLGLLLGACSTRSISNSGYDEGYGYRGNTYYQGELKVADVVGVPAGTAVGEAEIAAALKASEASALVPHRNQRLLVVQSGALTPDDDMMKALQGDFLVEGFSGLPPRQDADYAGRLRLMAAQGGFRQFLCYWGVLETEREGGVTKVVSWVPIVGSFIPDETQKMRIRIKALLVDVESGRWRVYGAEAAEDEAITASINRRSVDQDQVAALKVRGYQALADQLARSALP